MKIINIENSKELYLSVDQYILEQSYFCFIDWFLVENILSFNDYSDWRVQKINYIDDCINLSEHQLINLLKKIDNYLTKLNFTAHNEIFYSWQNDDLTQLCISSNTNFNQLLSAKWVRNKSIPQFDLFLDSTDELIRYDIVESIANQKYGKAKEHLNKLVAMTLQQEKKPEIFTSYQQLIDYGKYIEVQSIISREKIIFEIEKLEDIISPLAQNMMNIQSKEYLLYAWKWIARSSSKYPFDSNNPITHSSYTFLKLSDYKSAVNSITEVPNYKNNTILLYRLVMSYAALGQREKSMIHFCLLWELDNQFAISQLEKQTKFEPFLQPLVSLLLEFNGEFDEKYLELFPAYVFSQQSYLVHSKDLLKLLNNEKTLCMISLIRKKLEKGDEYKLRKEIQSFHVRLLQIYLDTID
ncbi:MAG: hypothetical protein GY829_12290 [Gammaproteobacteria bacterium]|nr:hypothetical protein [Gammaproteobacteria bacterium]